MTSSNMKRASLDEIRKMVETGEVMPPSASADGEDLGPHFWADAALVEPKISRSVHLKVDAEVFDFFKRQGKGHITRMQDVLKAYVRAQRG